MQMKSATAWRVRATIGLGLMIPLAVACSTIAGIDGQSSAECEGDGCPADATQEIGAEVAAEVAIESGADGVARDEGLVDAVDVRSDFSDAMPDVRDVSDAGGDAGGETGCAVGLVEPGTSPPCPKGMKLLAAGSFTRGDGAIPIKPFCIDIDEVSVSEFKAVCAACGDCGAALVERITGCYLNTWDAPGDMPINCVSYADAKAHCAALGRELLTEAEWEYAARGAPGDGGKGTTYPWGDTFDGTKLCWNRYGVGACTLRQFEGDRTPQEIYGLLGNLKEWTQDWDTDGVILRGCEWSVRSAEFCTNAAREVSTASRGRQNDRGFRCKLDIEP
jgi:hypothetical protein